MQINILAVSLVLLFGHAASAAVERLDQRLQGNRCGTNVIREMDRWEPNRNFARAASAFDGALAFRTPTRKTGYWIEVDLFPDNSVIAYRVTPKSVTRATFEGRNCTATFKEIPKLIDPVRLRKAFSDSDVEALVTRASNAVIYAWSPQMPYSVRAFKNAKAVAERLGMKFVPVLDSRASGRLADAQMREANMGPLAMKRMESVELMFRGMTNHYPSILVMKQGTLSRKVLPGYKTEAQYEAFIRRELGQ